MEEGFGHINNNPRPLMEILEVNKPETLEWREGGRDGGRDRLNKMGEALAILSMLQCLVREISLNVKFRACAKAFIDFFARFPKTSITEQNCSCQTSAESALCVCLT